MFEETIEIERNQSSSNNSMFISPAPRSVERSSEEFTMDLNRGRLDTTGSNNSDNASPAASQGVVQRLSMQQRGGQGGQRYKIFV